MGRVPGLQVQHLRLWETPTRRKLECGLTHVVAELGIGRETAGENDAAHSSRSYSPGEDVSAPRSSLEGRRLIEDLALQLVSARGLIVSAPAWNCGPPCVVKQYFDCVLHPESVPTAEGKRNLPDGGRPLFVITSPVDTASKDYFLPWLQSVAGLVGFDDKSTLMAMNVKEKDHSQSPQAARDSIACDAVDAARKFAAVLPLGMDLLPSLTADGGLSQHSGSEQGQQPEWDHNGLLGWLRKQGGLSEDCIEALQALRIDGDLFRQATAEDFRNEELGIEEDDITRLLALQHRFMASAGGVTSTRSSSDI